MQLITPDAALSDKVVLLRPWSDGDVDCVRDAATDASIPARTTVPTVFTPASGLAIISRQRRRLESGEGVSLAIADARPAARAGCHGWACVRSPA